MSFIKRTVNLIKNFLEGFLWSRESGNSRLMIESTLKEYAAKQSETRRTMTSLIFHKRQLEAKLEKMNSLSSFYNEKIEELAKNDQDQKALAYIAKSESLEGEVQFVKEQHNKLENDIAVAKKLEGDLKTKMVVAKEKMQVLSSRMEALKLRKKLKDSLSQLSLGSENLKVDSHVQKLEKEVFRLELESSEFTENSNDEAEFENWEQSKQLDSHLARLKEIKSHFSKPLKPKQLEYICT